jgi:hypothetical protein
MLVGIVTVSINARIGQRIRYGLYPYKDMHTPMSKRVYVHTRTYTCKHTYIYTHMQVHTYPHELTCPHANAGNMSEACTSTRQYYVLHCATADLARPFSLPCYSRRLVHAQSYAYTYARIYTLIHTHTHIYTRTHTHTYTHTHTHTHTFQLTFKKRDMRTHACTHI